MTFGEIRMGTPEYESALRLREAVLRAPLGLSLTEADLADESKCTHLAGFEDSNVVAVLLLKPLDADTIKMRQVAVRPELRGRGAGSKLVGFAEAFSRERGYKTIIAHAREDAVEFYRKVGYATSGEPFIETTIPHILVFKML